MKRLDLKKHKFNTFTILQEIEPHIEPSGRKRRKYLCLCICGEKFTSQQGPLLSGATKSCGCFRSRNLKKLATKHGLSKVFKDEYRSWCSMRSRCLNKKNKAYENYGGRGISVCEEWNRFDVFINDMGPRPPGFTIERKNNSEGYNRQNCIWADRLTQNNNRRPRRWKKRPTV